MSTTTDSSSLSSPEPDLTNGLTHAEVARIAAIANDVEDHETTREMKRAVIDALREYDRLIGGMRSPVSAEIAAGSELDLVRWKAIAEHNIAQRFNVPDETRVLMLIAEVTSLRAALDSERAEKAAAR